MAQALKIAVIGAGITGLHLARQMSDSSDVNVFEKSRGLGGRMCTRRTKAYQFDHGAQYFTAHGDRFRAFLSPYIEAGVVAQWSPRLVDLNAGRQTHITGKARYYVAVPGMTGLEKSMAEGVEIVGNTRITKIEKHGGKWQLTCADGQHFGPFDWVISTAPQPQTQALLPRSFLQFAGFGAVKMLACYSLMIGFKKQPDLGWDAAVVQDNPLAWIAVNGSKPGRGGRGGILCQSGNEWAQAHLEDDQTRVQDLLCHAFQKATGVDSGRADYVSLHRWRFAKVVQSTAEKFLMDQHQKLAAAGDWCGGGRVEAGFESAADLAEQLRLCLDG